MKNKKIVAALILASLISVSSCGKESSKTDRFKKYIASSQYSEATEYMSKHNVKLDKYTDFIKEQADDIMEKFEKGEIDASEANDQLRALKPFASDEANDYIYDKLDVISSAQDAEYNLSNAKYYMESKDYDNAMYYLDKIKEGSPSYEEAQKLLKECEEKYDAAIYDKAKSYADSGYFDDAISILENAKGKVKDSDKLEKTIKEYKEKQIDYEISQAEEYAEADPAYCIAKLEALLDKYPDNTAVKSAYKEHSEEYVENVIEAADKFVEEKDYASALEVIDSGLETLPDNAKLKKYREKIADKAPALLSSVEMKNADYFFAASETNYDVFGTEYEAKNTFFSSGYDEASAEFVLDKKYVNFEVTVVAYEKFKKGESVMVEIYGDDKLLTSQKVDEKTEPTKIKANVANVKKMKIKVTGVDDGDITSKPVLFSGGTLSANAEDSEKPEDATEEATKADEEATEATTEKAE